MHNTRMHTNSWARKCGGHISLRDTKLVCLYLGRHHHRRRRRGSGRERVISHFSSGGRDTFRSSDLRSLLAALCMALVPRDIIVIIAMIYVHVAFVCMRVWTSCQRHAYILY